MSDKATTVHIQTYGCQMNLADSRTVETLLRNAGFHIADGIEKADVILVNTCAVRDSAEQRAFGKLNSLSRWKSEGRIIGILGCIPQELKEDLRSRMPFLDLIVGPDDYRELPRLIDERLGLASDEPAYVATRLSRSELYDEILPHVTGDVSAFVTITRGCDKFCTYCVVPFVRGRERSRPLSSITAEVEALVARGTREVMLLGQNVDAYRWESKSFADCLSAVAEVKGLERVRFLTSHPQDIHVSLFEVMAANPKICPYLHLPVQSGSNRILGLMNRGYTRERYIDIIEEARALVSGIALSTDIIVGFPSETEREFEETLELAEQIRFDSAFMFKYSVRPNTKAAKMPDDVPEPEKIRRLEKLIAQQNGISRQRNKAQIGRVDEVLIEGFSPKNNKWLFGRTPDFRPVVFSPNGEGPGQVIKLRLTELRGFTFVGEHIIK